MFPKTFRPLAAVVLAAIALSSCEAPPRQAPRYGGGGGGGQTRSPGSLYREVNVIKDFIPAGRFGRRLNRPMRPTYITIHSTQNPTGDAFAHARAVNRGALRGGVCGYLCWHYTVQENLAIQHIPTTEQGEHADFDGPGNRYSIGIEMCEHHGNNLDATIDRTAKLAACLMRQYNIPLSHVVPHYHWPRPRKNPPNKNCPHFLLENGRPGAKWRWFVQKVGRYYQSMS